MRISRLYLDQPLHANRELAITGQAAHYLATVLRLPIGATVKFFNGDGHEYLATLSAVHKNQIVAQLGSSSQPATESTLHTVLGLGISRGERMDYAIQKSSELGVHLIAPLFTEHCEVKLQGERSDKRQAHWQQIAISACEQSGRVRVPTVLAPQPLSAWLSNTSTELKLVLDHEEAGQLPAARPSGVSLLIGPEGGLATAEIAQAKQAGFSGLALGKRVLRTETAPVVALAVLQHRWDG